MRVASVPRRHPCTRHIGWPGDVVTRIATSDDTYRASDLIDAAWVRDHRDEFDCVHTHFGVGDVGSPPLSRGWRSEQRRELAAAHASIDAGIAS